MLTEAGRTAAGLSDPDVRQAVSQGYSNGHPRRSKQESSAALIVDQIVDQPPENDENWSDQLLAKPQSIEPSAFERLCQRLLREHGFIRVEVTGKSGDGGTDGQGVLQVNLVSFHVLFQCKRYKGSMSSSAIRDFIGAMQGRADKGLVIKTGTFTLDARREATRGGAPAIDLIDGDALCELLREKTLGVVVRPVTTCEISVDENFFKII